MPATTGTPVTVRPSALLSGTAVPDASLGYNGDMYFRTTSGTVYGPKSAGAWGSAVSVIGTAETFVADPTGGATTDTQARAAIASILDILIAKGIMAAS